MKIISYSLWGTDLKYLVGAQRNADLIDEIYPGWVGRFYIAETTPYSFIADLESRENCQVIIKPGMGDWKSMYWRFEPAGESNVDVMISRDTDSRINLREKTAVDEWLASDKGFHIMRDHPWHNFPVLGGMWGAKKGVLPDMKDLINNFAQEDKYGTDYEFFASLMAARIKDNCMIHDEFFGSRPFPVERQNYEFVGQVFDEKESTVVEHVDALKKQVNQKNLYIHHHLGLGDHIDCNGMVRLFLKDKRLEKVYVFAKNNYFNLIEYMYRDEKDIIVVPVDKNDEYSSIQKYLFDNKVTNFLQVGHQHYPWGQEEKLNMGCAEIFYKQVGIDYQERFNSYYCERDHKEEDRVFKKLNPNNEEYVFVHDDPDRGFAISDEKIYELNNGPIKIIKNDMEENLFHFIKILENAKQIHCMESCFRSIVETTDVTGELFFHNFRDAASGFLGNSTKQNWKEIK